MSVRPSASRTEEGARETGKGLVARTWRRSKAVGGGSLGFFFALCCLGKIPGGAPFSQLHKSGNGSRVDRP